MQEYEKGAGHFYNKNLAAELESKSGFASSLIETFFLRDFVKRVVSDYDIKTVADAPCGDLNWVRAVNLDNVKYIGYDILQDHVEANRKLDPSKTFEVYDLVEGVIPKVDLILCKDFFTHIEDGLVRKVLENFRASGSKYMISTTYPDPINTLMNDQELKVTGWGFREINLSDFGLTPIEMIQDNKKRHHGLYILNSDD